MNYRVVLVFDKSDQVLHIEISFETGSKSLPPFQRKILLEDLLKQADFVQMPVFELLGSVGQWKQPFKLDREQLKRSVVQECLNMPWSYVRSGGRSSSLKRVSSLHSFLPFPTDDTSLRIGNLISCEIYINNPQRWWVDMEVRFCYENFLGRFSIIDRGIPCKDIDGGYFNRDREKEEAFLLPISYGLDRRKSVLNLSGQDTSVLKRLAEDGWKIFIKASNASFTRLHVQKNTYGIDWFVTDDNQRIDKEIAERLLESFLRGKNYVEYEGKVAIFNPKDMMKLPTSEVGVILGVASKLNDIYRPVHELSRQEIDRIDCCLHEKVHAQLHVYQRDGILWLVKMRKHGTGCLLADDMGLGKTLQTVAYLRTRPEATRHLVVCPASLTRNWKNEIDRFTPSLSERIHIVSYDMLRLYQDHYSEVDFDTVVIDEGQIVKNDSTQRYKSISAVRCQHKIMLSGTPVENDIREIWAQFRLLIPQTKYLYQKLMALNVPLGDTQFVELTKSLLSPFILRRLKSEVLPGLPHLSEHIIPVELSNEEKTVYRSIQGAFQEALREGVTGRVNDLALQTLLRLRQCCISINLLPKSISLKRDFLSAKFSVILGYLEDFIDRGHKILVFSQFTSALDEFKEILDRRGILYDSLTGLSTNRQRLVDSFQNNSSVRVFLISLHAGGVGLNLTAADRVIFMDNWWNPAVEEQAFSRAYRIGQQKNVEVYRFICRGTVEEKILELQTLKKDVSDIFNSSGTTLSLEQITKIIG